MIFTKDSGLVKVWVSLIQDEDSPYELDDVPANLFNLKEVVEEVLNEAK